MTADLRPKKNTSTGHPDLRHFARTLLFGKKTEEVYLEKTFGKTPHKSMFPHRFLLPSQ
jgi:hypothetical protein